MWHDKCTILLNPVIFQLSSDSNVVFVEGELDMANPRHLFKAEGNAWIQQLEDQIVLGPSHVFEYIKTDGYKR